MLDSETQNPYATPAQTIGAASPSRSSSLLWIVPGGSLGTIIGAFIIRCADEMFGDASTIAVFIMLGVFGFSALLGSMIWRLPRRFICGPIRTPRIARFVSGAMLAVMSIFVLQMGRTRMIALPEPAMGLTVISLLVVCAVSCVEFEAWYGNRMHRPSDLDANNALTCEIPSDTAHH